MTAQQEAPGNTIWVPGHAGWQGRQRSTSGLVLLGVLLGLFIVVYGVVSIIDPAPAMKLLGAGVIVAVAVGVWLLAVHVRTSRVRVVRPVVEGEEVVFGGPAETIPPLRALAPVGVLIIAGWGWSIVSVPADRLTTLTLLVVPVIGAILAIAGIRSWFRPLGAHRLALRPTGVELRIPRNNAVVSWDDLAEASLEGERVILRTTTGRASSWAVGDLASDPVILAELLTFYATRPEARAEIGAPTLARLRSGEF